MEKLIVSRFAFKSLNSMSSITDYVSKVLKDVITKIGCFGLAKGQMILINATSFQKSLKWVEIESYLELLKQQLILPTTIMV